MLLPDGISVLILLSLVEGAEILGREMALRLDLRLAPRSIF